MITREDVENAFSNMINSLERTRESSNILISLDELQSLTITIGYTKNDSIFFIIGDSLSTLSYHLKSIYSRFIPGLVPTEIQSAATSKLIEVLDQVKNSLKILREELFRKERPDYKVVLDNIGRIYIGSYDLFKFGSSYIIPTAPSE